MAATSVRIDRPAERDPGDLGHAIDDGLRPDLVERDPTELRGVERSDHGALLEELRRQLGFAVEHRQPEVVPAHPTDEDRTYVRLVASARRLEGWPGDPRRMAVPPVADPPWAGGLRRPPLPRRRRSARTAMGSAAGRARARAGRAAGGPPGFDRAAVRRVHLSVPAV